MTIIAMLLTGALFLGPLIWRIRVDAGRARADLIAADIRAAICRRFRGETYLSVHVTPSTFRQPGRVTLSAPAGFDWLLAEAWRDVMREVPVGYELVVKAEDARAGSRREAMARPLPRAA